MGDRVPHAMVCSIGQRGMANRVHSFGYYAPMEDLSLDIRTMRAAALVKPSRIRQRREEASGMSVAGVLSQSCHARKTLVRIRFSRSPDTECRYPRGGKAQYP